MTVVLYLNGGSFVESLRQITDFQRDFLRTVLWRTYMQLWLVAILIFPVSIVSIDWLHLALSFLGTRGREVKLLCVVCLCVGLGVGGTGALILGLIGELHPVTAAVPLHLISTPYRWSTRRWVVAVRAGAQTLAVHFADRLLYMFISSCSPWSQVQGCSERPRLEISWRFSSGWWREGSSTHHQVLGKLISNFQA